MSDNDFRRGPGSRYGRGAVLEVYADTQALDRPCPSCGAKLGEFCRHSDGAQRKIPCPPRRVYPEAPENPGAGQ